MKPPIRLQKLLALLILCAVVFGFAPSTGVAQKAKPKSTVSEQSVRKYMAVLASDEMRGRGSASPDELKAAEYIASQLKLLKIEPAGDNGGYLQTVKFTRRSRRNPDAPPVEAVTTNVIGILRGSDRVLSKEAVLLSAHLDHLGVGREVNGDTIYNGADDDASGVTAVLGLAEALAAGPKPKRTVLFVLFGSEEIGGWGARHFQEHPPVPLESIIANLQFEMIGRPDAAVAPRTLWLTGYERSDLGEQLAKHGARLVADPHPDQRFFQRSDNYVLAKKGIIAHTVSSFGLHADYHRPSDDLAHVDFAHMTDAIASMVEPVRWLVNSKFKPQWKEGGKP